VARVSAAARAEPVLADEEHGRVSEKAVIRERVDREGVVSWEVVWRGEVLMYTFDRLDVYELERSGDARWESGDVGSVFFPVVDG
jgi:hypothetical protein